jgi:predicted ATPase/class 3 adenylate cyclase
MPQPPTGTITFLFTDLEGSAHLWEQRPAAMERALAHHDTLVRDTLEAHGGYAFKTVGDAFHAAFTAPSDALAAAIAVQRRLAAELWETDQPLRARVALHCGTAQLRDGDYFGPTLNRVARLRDAGHGGQILLSAVTATLVRGQAPDGVELRDLGVYRLRDLAEPEQVYQAAVWGLPADFPPLRTAGVRGVGQPAALTSFIGREREVEEMTHLLASARLVTITGMGGSGKTRLALRVAAAVAGTFDNGVVFVDLAPIADPELAVASIARAVGVQGASDLPFLERIAIALHAQSLLLLLDNFEHLLVAAPLIPSLLQAAPDLVILVTSRAPLRVRGEREFPLAPLGHPETAEVATPASLASFPAVSLFVERARDVRPDFALTETNAAAVAEICRRLDGLPLAIELAAARIRHLSAAAIAARLVSRLALLTDGARDLPERQRTLRDTIAWSHNLLPPEDQRLFRRLAVFSGGGTLEAIASVCDVEGDHESIVLDGLASLIESSLVQRLDDADGEPRYRMLETVREYAWERLETSGESATLRHRHAEYFAALAEAVEPRLLQASHGPWLRRLDVESDNVRAARAWSDGGGDGGEVALRLAWALWRYWLTRGALEEGRVATAAALARPAARAGPARAAALFSAGFLAREVGDLAAARALLEECVRLGPVQGNPRAHALALAFLATVLVASGELDAARRLAEEGLTFAQSLNERHARAWSNQALFQVCLRVGDIAGARRYADEALRLGRQDGITPIGLHAQAMVDMAEGRHESARARVTEMLAVARDWDDAFLIAAALHQLAVIALEQGDLVHAEALLDESIGRSRRSGVDTSGGLATLGWVVLRRGEQRARAAALLAEALPLSRQRGGHDTLVACLGGLACVAASAGDAEPAARLVAAADAWRETHGVLLPETQQSECQRTIATLREQLGEPAFVTAYADGRILTVDAAVALALDLAERVQHDAASAAGP